MEVYCKNSMSVIIKTNVFFLLQVKSGFLQEEDVKIVSKQIRDRINQYKSKGSVIESQSKTGDINQDVQSIQDAGIAGTSGHVNDPHHSQSFVNNDSSSQQHTPHTVQTQTSVQAVLQQQSVDMSSNEKVNTTTSEHMITETSEVPPMDSQQEKGKLLSRHL